MNNIKKESIGKLCSEYYIEYGRELNSNRALPLIMDGLKPSYRRAIYVALNSPGNHIKSLDFVGNMAKMHPHGDKSIVGVENKLVRAKVFKELGNFGYYPLYGAQMSPAAPRYTSTGIEDNWYDIMSPLLPYVPYMEGETEGIIEPEYLPTMIPLSLVFGSIGIGLGINTNIPNFSPQSILDAYNNDDPSLLKPYYDLEIDYENSQLERLWEKGIGKVIYKYHLEVGTDNNGSDGVWVYGDTNVFIPDWTQIEEWKSQGLIFTRDESTGGKPCIFVGRNKGVRKVNQEMILEELQRCTSSANVFSEIQTIYRLGIHDSEVARYIPMKEWVEVTYNNYLEIFERYRKGNIDKINFDIKVNTYLKQVAEILMTAEHDITNQEIADQLEIETEVVNAITRKSISTLKRVDTDSIIKSLKQKRKEFKNLDVIEFINSTVAKM